jgi:4'-phosphopantetheinyl transferase
VHVHLATPPWTCDVSLLSEEERAIAARFVFERDRTLYLAAHAFLHATLTAYLGRNPLFARDANGRPELSDRTLRFNLSHTEGMVAVAVTREADVGVDVERIRPVDDLLAKAVFTAEELHAWPGDARSFFERWTLKEAYVKARGRGLSIDLQSFGFAGDRLVCSDDDANAWSSFTLAPTAAHRAAVVVRDAAARLTVVEP